MLIVEVEVEVELLEMRLIEFFVEGGRGKGEGGRRKELGGERLITGRGTGRFACKERAQSDLSSDLSSEVEKFVDVESKA